MKRQAVYVLCAEGEETFAEQLAGPLREAGYDVTHAGTVAVGESQIWSVTNLLMTGAPLVVCGTMKAVGSNWANHIAYAAHSNGDNRVFVVQMDGRAHVKQLAVETKVARFDLDPAQGVRDLISSLAQRFPPKLTVLESIPRSDSQYTDRLRTSTGFDFDALRRFRGDLRPEVEAVYPAMLSPREFLERAALIDEGQLTGTGVLLFGERPALMFPAAQVQCMRYYGLNQAAPRERERFGGTVPDQIVAAREFVARHVRRGELPSSEQAAARPVYEYPMLAVRELIANAVVHRDYSAMDAWVHVRIFQDRLEVSSPGVWIDRDLTDGVQRELSTLVGQSKKRNHLLASIVSWISLVEADGSGIPTVLQDCAAIGARPPLVKQDQGFITVTLWPRPDPTLMAREASEKSIVVGKFPAAPPAFIVRSTETRLAETLSASPVAVVCAVTGMRGVGKTHVAAAYARSWIQDRRGLVGWVNAESVGTAVADLARIAAAVGVQDPKGDSAVSAARLRERLASWPGDSLIVFDNAADPDKLLPLLPTLGRTRVVITSTDAAFTELGEVVEITQFTRAESVEYLRARTGLDDKIGAAGVAAELGDLPLALAAAAANIRQHRTREYSHYLDELRRYPVREVLLRVPGHEYRDSTAAALLMSVDAVISGSDRLVARLIAMLAVLSPDGVRLDVLSTLDDRHGNSATPSPALYGAIEHCRRSSVLSWSVSGDMLTMHRLLARVVRERASTNDTLGEWHADALHVLEPHMFEESHAWNRKELGLHLVSQIEALWASGIGDTPRETVERAAVARSWAVRQLSASADLTRAADVARQAVADFTRTLGPDHPQTFTARRNLAGALRQRGRLSDAIALYERTLADCERVLGPGHPDTLTSQNSLAGAYRAVGRLAEAIQLFEYTLSEREQVLGQDHPHTFVSRDELAGTYRTALRDGDAIPLYEKTLADRERVFGKDHPDALASRNNLASAYWATGRLSEAIPLFERTLADCVRVLGPDHPDTLTAQNNLAGAYRSAGRLPAAITLYERTLADCVRVLGPDHPDTLSSQNNLAGTYRSADRLYDAITLHRRTLDARIRILGPDHPDTLTSRNNLAGVYKWAGEFKDATALYKRTLADRERVLGRDHPETLRTRYDLASTYRAARRFDKAIATFEVALADLERVCGPDYPLSIETRKKLKDVRRLAARPERSGTAAPDTYLGEQPEGELTQIRPIIDFGQSNQT
ncbi:FxSxx-COOH system tetratricopeptide repeat protein [Nocardia vinacea]|uniref:FxSxx-COOH system tetratricopeptide repeat protein n=1 Tax=Nocardia vinacea TaxID=96468 RepID=UPI0034210AF8